MSALEIKRALIAVYDKTGIAPFARTLVDELGIEIISTGGTARHLKEAGVPVTLVEEVTGFPEMLDGRVKTLHPRIHAAILADRDNPEHMRQLAEHGIEPIDMVVVNLYPFEETIARPDCTFEQAIEMIDIGGPCLLRAAAKNSRHVVVLTSPSPAILAYLREPSQWDPEAFRQARAEHAREVFWLISRYDATIATWLGRRPELGEYTMDLLAAHLEESGMGDLRYGENPHQQATCYDVGSTPEREGCLVAGFGVKQSEADMSFNNYVDGDAALSLVRELTRAGQLVWHRFSTGDPEATTAVDARVDEHRETRRNLPHLQNPSSTYFVTFRLRRGDLSPDERGITLEACRFWHGEKATFHAIVVMADHVHLLVTPHEVAPGKWAALGELLHSIKRHSAREINRRRGRSGSLWLDESFDRIVRNKDEFREKWEYMEANPITADLPDAQHYPWFWSSETDFRETVEDHHRWDPGAAAGAQRSETGTTTDVKHRLQTGATFHAVAFIKHTNACGCAIGDDSIDTYRRAYLGDPIAAAGGVLCMNFAVTRAIAETVMLSFKNWGKAAGAAFFKLDVWIAPSFDDDAIELITTPTAKRKWGASCRLLAVGGMSAPPDPNGMDFKKITGGMLVQQRDLIGLNEDQWKVVTRRVPSPSEMADLRFAWLVCKHTKSNAITICRDGMLLGNGAGQMSRVKSCDLAIQLARENSHGDQLEGAVAAGDAFFPVPDGPQKLIDAGITAIIQPGGSNRDADTVAVCDEASVAMIMTGTRHFKH